MFISHLPELLNSSRQGIWQAYPLRPTSRAPCCLSSGTAGVCRANKQMMLSTHIGIHRCLSRKLIYITLDNAQLRVTQLRFSGSMVITKCDLTRADKYDIENQLRISYEQIAPCCVKSLWRKDQFVMPHKTKTNSKNFFITYCVAVDD